MNAVKDFALISEADYLAGELASTVKHEYVAGVLYPMAGANNAHSRIAGNVFALFDGRLRDGPCEAFHSDTKIRVRLPQETRFYYPDVSVTCRPNPQDDSWQDEPTLVVEVLSASTRRVDFGEKKDAYLSIASLEAYLLIEQEAPLVEVHRRTADGFVRERYRGLNATLRLETIRSELSLAEIYRRVIFATEPSQE
jgi:Uma2 family endonuclease